MGFGGIVDGLLDKDGVECGAVGFCAVTVGGDDRGLGLCGEDGRGETKEQTPGAKAPFALVA
jgi:hypothetical protein